MEKRTEKLLEEFIQRYPYLGVCREDMAAAKPS